MEEVALGDNAVDGSGGSRFRVVGSVVRNDAGAAGVIDLDLGKDVGSELAQVHPVPLADVVAKHRAGIIGPSKDFLCVVGIARRKE